MPAGKLLWSTCHCCVSGSLLCYADLLSSEFLPSLYFGYLQSSQAWSHSCEHNSAFVLWGLGLPNSLASVIFHGKVFEGGLCSLSSSYLFPSKNSLKCYQH